MIKTVHLKGVSVVGGKLISVAYCLKMQSLSVGQVLNIIMVVINEKTG
jgi:hypothetical protein